MTVLRSVKNMNLGKETLLADKFGAALREGAALSWMLWAAGLSSGRETRREDITDTETAQAKV
jgi:hypothetical protein